MRLSERGLQLLRAFEGLKLTAYKPIPSDPWTIGFGSTRYADGRPVREGDTITPGEAEELLRATLRQYEDAVSSLVTVPLTQANFDALTVFVYNVGIGAFKASTLLRKLNAGDYRGASSEFLRWNKAGGNVLHGLVRRREAERELFLSELPAVAPEPTTVGVRPNAAPAGLDTPPMPVATPVPETKPMSPLIGPLIGLLTSVAPDLVRIFTDKDKPVAERNTEAAIKVLDIAKKVAESPTPAAAVEAIVADPAKAEAFRAAVREQWYELAESGGGGIEAARRTALAVTAGQDWRALGYGATIALLALLIVGGGGFMLWSLIHDAKTTAEQRGMLIGALVALIGSPVAFFFGSSVSSRAKDSALVDQLGKR